MVCWVCTRDHCLPLVLGLVLIHNVAFMKNLDYATPNVRSPTLTILGSNPIMTIDVNPVIWTTIVPTLGSLGNEISSNDRMPLWILKLMITIQTDKGFCISYPKNFCCFPSTMGITSWKTIGVKAKICSSKLSNYILHMNLASWHNLQHSNREDCPIASILKILSLAWNNISTLGIKKWVKWLRELVQWGTQIFPILGTSLILKKLDSTSLHKVCYEMELALESTYNLPSTWSIPQLGPNLCLGDDSSMHAFNANVTYLCFYSIKGENTLKCNTFKHMWKYSFESPLCYGYSKTIHEIHTMWL